MRTGGVTYYLFPDHLGGTHITASGTNGAELGKLLYRPWGETRVNSGTTLTTWRFTGQREDCRRRAIGLYYYGARYYDPQLGRFAQADTIVPNPGDPQALNRYSYALNNAVRYTDPTGMFSEDEIMKYLGVTTWDEVLAMFGEGGAMAGVWGYLEALREAQLGTPIKMWFDVSYGFNKNQPDMTGIFYEQNGDLMFAATFTNWSGAGVSWSVVGLSATAASQTLGAAAIYQVGSLGSYLDPNQQYIHLQFDATRVDWLGVGLDATGIVADAVTAGAGGRVINGIQIADVARVTGETLDVASMYNSGAALAVDIHEGNSSGASLAGFGLATAGLYVPVIPDAVSLLWGLSQGFYSTP